MHSDTMATITSLDLPVHQVRVVTLSDIVVLVIRSWRFVVTGAVLCCLVGIGIALLMPRVYRAEVVAVTTESTGSNPLSRIAGQFGSLAALGGINLPSESNRNETLALLRSKDFATRIIEEEGLMPVLFARRWNAATHRWRVTDPADVPTLSDAWELFDKRIRTVIDDRDRGLVTLRIELHDRKLAADLANSMVAKLNEALRQRKLQELDDSIQYLQRESLKTTLLPLRDVMASVMETQVSERMLATARKDYALRVIDPATMPDVRRYVQPKPVLTGALGFVLGGMLGFAVSLMRSYHRRTQL